MLLKAFCSLFDRTFTGCPGSVSECSTFLNKHGSGPDGPVHFQNSVDGHEFGVDRVGDKIVTGDGEEGHHDRPDQNAHKGISSPSYHNGRKKDFRRHIEPAYTYCPHKAGNAQGSKHSAAAALPGYYRQFAAAH